MIQQFRNSFLTWYGWALVPMSKSFGRRPSSRSRTLPLEDLQGIGVDILPGNGVVGPGNDGWRCHVG